MADFYYNSTHKMPPRPGQEFSTTYYRQDLAARKKVCRHVRTVLDTLAQAPSCEIDSWLDEKLKGHRHRKTKQLYTVAEVLNDMSNECTGTKKDGLPKDLAQAPIDRWNRVFQGYPDFQIRMKEKPPLGHQILVVEE